MSSRTLAHATGGSISQGKAGGECATIRPDTIKTRTKKTLAILISTPMNQTKSETTLEMHSERDTWINDQIRWFDRDDHDWTRSDDRSQEAGRSLRHSLEIEKKSRTRAKRANKVVERYRSAFEEVRDELTTIAQRINSEGAAMDIEAVIERIEDVAQLVPDDAI